MNRQDLVIHCPDCQNDWPEGTLFCDFCGASLSPWLAADEESESFQDEATPIESWAEISGALYGVPTETPLDQTDGQATSTISAENIGVSDDDEDWMDIAPSGARRANDQASAPPQKPPEIIWLRLSDGQLFELQGKIQYLIGRRDPKRHVAPDVDLTDWNGAMQGVSRIHASIYITAIGVYVEDLESRNETLLNGYRLLPRQRYRLEDTDDLRLGMLALNVHFVRP